jgi:protein-L-isoaspartate(D-aspartate) O-methyltransferase
MEDTFRHKGLRHQLVESLRRKGIQDENVLKALEAVPRHFFFDSSFLEFAYQDKPFPIGAGQTISQPFTVAFQSELLAIKKGDKVLEIGTGSGYQACILCEMGAKVFSIERQKLLFDKAKAFIPTLGYRMKTFYGDGYLGQPAFAPFDKIIITAGAPYIPEALVQQLKTGGILVAPIGNTDIQEMTTVVKLTETSTRIKSHGRFRFVPMLGDKATDK